MQLGPHWPGGQAATKGQNKSDMLLVLKKRQKSVLMTNFFGKGQRKDSKGFDFQNKRLSHLQYSTGLLPQAILTAQPPTLKGKCYIWPLMLWWAWLLCTFFHNHILFWRILYPILMTTLHETCIGERGQRGVKSVSVDVLIIGLHSRWEQSLPIQPG